MHFSTSATLLFSLSTLSSTIAAAIPSSNASASTSKSNLTSVSFRRPATMVEEANLFDTILKNALGQVGPARSKAPASQLQGALTASHANVPAKRSRHATFDGKRRRSMKLAIPEEKLLEVRAYLPSTLGYKGMGLGPVMLPNVQYVIPAAISSPSTVVPVTVELIATPIAYVTPTPISTPIATPVAVPVAAPVVAPVAASTWPSSGGMISAAYYADWDGASLPPSKINFALFDMINFAFAVPTSDFNIQFTQDASASLLNELVTLAHASNTKVMLSVGGWSSSNYFSTAVSTYDNRVLFVNNIVNFAKQFGVDGVDIDWEYPGTTGADGNAESSEDTANFLQFLILLKSTLATGQRISACVTANAFIGADGSPLTDVSAFGQVLDSVLLMVYDVWGSSSTPGANAPLTNACPDSNQPNANGQAAIAQWTAAGFPKEKLLLGVPAYGYISSSSATTLVHKKRSVEDSAIVGGLNNRDRAKASFALAEAKVTESFMHKRFDLGQIKSQKRKEAQAVEKRAERKRNGDILKTRSTLVMCPNNHSKKPCEAEAAGQAIAKINWNPVTGTKLTTLTGQVAHGVFSGTAGVGKLGDGTLTSITGNQIEFWQLISNGVLVKEASGDFASINGYTRAWDSCSSTPYLYDTNRNTVITYDDNVSMKLKGQLAASNGIQGINMWEMSGDTADWDITRSFRSGMGLAKF